MLQCNKPSVYSLTYSIEIKHIPMKLYCQISVSKSFYIFVTEKKRNTEIIQFAS